MRKPADRASNFSNVLKRSAKNLPSFFCLMLEDAGLAEETGTARAYQWECRLGITRPELATLRALIHAARDQKATFNVLWVQK